jgi:hypothetical protein
LIVLYRKHVRSIGEPEALADEMLTKTFIMQSLLRYRIFTSAFLAGPEQQSGNNTQLFVI